MFSCYIQCFIHLSSKSFTLNLLNARQVEKLVVRGPGGSKQIVFMHSEEKNMQSKWDQVLQDLN